MNLKLIGTDLINFDHLISLHLGKDQGGLKARMRFVDGSELEFGHRAAMILLNWIELYIDAEVDPLGQYDEATPGIDR
jgi:hypothetical protein